MFVFSEKTLIEIRIKIVKLVKLIAKLIWFKNGMYGFEKYISINLNINYKNSMAIYPY